MNKKFMSRAIELSIESVNRGTGPFGAVIVFENFLHKQTGIVKNYAEKANLSFNNSVFFAWLTSFGLFYFISVQFDVFLSFVTLPAWLLCGVLFLVLSKYSQK